MTDIGRFKQTVISTNNEDSVHQSDRSDVVQYNGTWNRLAVLGNGSFGTVYREHCLENGKVRAVKKVRRGQVKDIEREIQCMIKVREVSYYFLPSFRPTAVNAH